MKRELRVLKPSLVDPNIFVLLAAISSSMENSMELLSATMQTNVLVMTNTIREGFVGRSFCWRNPPHPLQETSMYLVAGGSRWFFGVITQKILEHAEGGLYCLSGGGFAKPLRRGRSSGWCPPPGPLCLLLRSWTTCGYFYPDRWQ